MKIDWKLKASIFHKKENNAKSFEMYLIHLLYSVDIYYCIWWPLRFYHMEDCKRILELRKIMKCSISDLWFWDNYLFLLLNNNCSTIRPQRCQTNYTDDEVVCQPIGDSRSPTHLTLCDSVWFNGETPFKFSPSAKYGSVSLKTI